jgi:esterase/lipase
MKTSSNLRGGYFSMKPAYVDRFPLKATFSTKEEKEIYEQIIQTVTRINTISNTKSDIVTREVLTLRETIDDLICRLYGLTDEERRIVDGFGAPL